MSTSTPIAAAARPAARSRRLGELSAGHDNNLNLLRVLAASLVLVSHSFVIATGDPMAEPWARHFGITPGAVAVDAFFTISGFLVTASLLGSRSLWRFATARALRIYPALWLALGLTVLVVGLGFSDVAPAAFFRDARTWKYLGVNALMVKAEAGLPGAFAHVPFAGAVNGSLWTLRYELRMYALLALCWFVARRLAPARTEAVFGRAVVALGVVLAVLGVALPLLGHPFDFVALGAMFFQGAALCVLRGRVPVGAAGLAALVSAIGLAAALAPVAVFLVVYRLCLPLAVLHLGFLPGGPLRAYNRLGDYSYGIYIFAFPVQQMLASRLPGLGPWGVMAGAALPVAVLAVLSWRLVERRALARKDALARRLARAFGG